MRFEEKLQYEALSYRWGDEISPDKIVLDTVEHTVTQNLHDALEYFRIRKPGTPLWIDALSINQLDVSEKNQQLKIMPHIYFRAVRILIWLGKKYVSQKFDDKADLLVQDAAQDEYWSRLWIVQEIGKARDIEVCIGKSTGVNWENFIKSVWQYSTNKDGLDEDATNEDGPNQVGLNKFGPLQLDRLRKGKFDGEHKLRNLLLKYSQALCQNPRDKVYGLVGLSVDGRNLPTDYRKSPLEVWYDTVQFMSTNALLPAKPKDTALLFQTLRDALGADSLGAVNGVVQFESPNGRTTLTRNQFNTKTDTSVRLMCSVVGAVVSLGPSLDEMTSSLELADRFEEELNRTYSTKFMDELGPAFDEYESMMDHCLQTPSSELPKASTYETSSIEYSGADMYGSLWMAHNSRFTDSGWMCPGIGEPWTYESKTPDRPRLALLRFEESRESKHKIAIVAPGTLIGDVVYSYVGSPMKRIVMRYLPGQGDRSREITYVCGTAILVQDIRAGKTKAADSQGWTSLGVTGLSHDIRMDVRTLYALMFGNRDT